MADSQRKERMSEQTNGCSEVKATVQRYMDPVSVALNLWASQRLHKCAGGSGFVTWGEVFPGVPLDEEGQVKPDPPDYRKDGGAPASALQTDRSDVLYESSAGKYAQVPRWDWSTASACEVVEWALAEFSGGTDDEAKERSEFMRDLLCKIHPDVGRYSLPNESNDPFVATARRVLDKGAVERDAKDYARVMRSSYGAFRKVMWVAIGSKTGEDRRMAHSVRSEYVDRRRQVNALDAKEIVQTRATKPGTIAS